MNDKRVTAIQESKERAAMRKKTGRNKKMDANECVEKRTEDVQVPIVIACTPVHLPSYGILGPEIKEREDGIAK